MSLKFRVIERRVLAGPMKDRTMFYGHVYAGSTVGFDELCEEVSEHSTATRGDVEVALRGLEYCLLQELRAGNSVQLGEMAYLRLSGSSKPSVSVREFTLKMMKKPKVVFKAGKKLKYLCKQATFSLEHEKTVRDENDCIGPHK